MIIPVDNKEIEKGDYLRGVETTPLNISCPPTLFAKFEKYCKEEAGGNKILALNQLLEYAMVDGKTQLLIERDEELARQINELRLLIEEKIIKKASPKFFGQSTGETHE